jgi:hypothetical protein
MTAQQRQIVKTFRSGLFTVHNVTNKNIYFIKYVFIKKHNCIFTTTKTNIYEIPPLDMSGM